MTGNLARTVATRPALGRPAWPVVAGGAVIHRQARPDDELRVLQDIGTTISFGRNETIFSEGDATKYAYKVVSGAVRQCKLLSDGRRQVTDFFMPDDLFGFTEFGLHAFSAEAITHVVLIRYARSHVDRLGDENMLFRRKLTMVLHERVSHIQHHLVMLGRQTVKERIASFLLQMAERNGAAHGGGIDLPMGRQDIADYLALTIETVCRSLGELKRAGTIGVPNTHQILINDVDTLRAVAEGEN